MPTLEAKEMQLPISTIDCASLRGMQDCGLYGELKKRILITMADTMDKTSLVKLKETCVHVDSIN